MGVQIFKASGTGNTFLILDQLKTSKGFAKQQWHSTFGRQSRSKVSQKLCSIHQGIGADGFLVLEPDTTADLRWDFYNADGSKAEMCGNAARCVALYMHQIYKGRDFSIRTGSGIVRAVVHSSKDIEVTMTSIKFYTPNLMTSVNGKKILFSFVQSGVPHSVVKVDNLNNVEKLGYIVDKIRALKRFYKHGTNVTFYKDAGINRIHSLTFERGVPGYTQSCGTGAVAAAFCYGAISNTTKKIQVKVPGGHLSVRPNKGLHPILVGPAVIIAKFEIIGD